LDKTTINALIVGIVIYAVVIVLASMQRELTGSQLILMLVAPLLTGILSKGVKKGLILGSSVAFVMIIVELNVLEPGVFVDINLIMAMILMMALPVAAISALLGAIGGFLGKRIFKVKEQKAQPQPHA